MVKALDGFKKGHHTVPDAVNPVTQAFLARIANTALSAEAERLFQDARTALGYKRKEIGLEIAAGSAVLTTRDFVVEIVYALENEASERYTVTTTLRGLKQGDLAATEPFDALFRGRFTEISFVLVKGARVEAVIDAIEALNGEGGLGVTYPSDCRECVISVEGVDASVRCTAASLEMVFPRAGSPRELMEAFAAVRAAFAAAAPLAEMVA